MIYLSDYAYGNSHVWEGVAAGFVPAQLPEGQNRFGIEMLVSDFITSGPKYGRP